MAWRTKKYEPIFQMSWNIPSRALAASVVNNKTHIMTAMASFCYYINAPELDRCGSGTDELVSRRRVKYSYGIVLGFEVERCRPASGVCWTYVRIQAKRGKTSIPKLSSLSCASRRSHCCLAWVGSWDPRGQAIHVVLPKLTPVHATRKNVSRPRRYRCCVEASAREKQVLGAWGPQKTADRFAPDTFHFVRS